LNFRVILFIFLGFILFHSLTYTHAARRTVDTDFYEPDGQNGDSLKDARARINDSIREARTHSSDSIKAARSHNADSIKTARQQKTDSVQIARKHTTDSASNIRKYHDSKRYKDSVASARNKKTRAVTKIRQSKADSLKDARKTITDSIANVRKTKTNIIKTAQKQRTDSLAKIKKYKGSKRYADSVTLTRRERTDSIKTTQKSARDNIASVRKHSMDSTKAVRKKTMDSVKTVRTKTLDSIKVVRKARTDSFAKVKKQKEALAKSKEKKKDEDKKLKLEIKMKQKHEAWSNKSMLKKKWSPVRRVTQNSFTHYNYYYNANKKMEEALLNMQRGRKENYDSLIGLYPFDPNKDSMLMSSDMDTIVRKISVGIQIHDPRVKWSNDLYLLLGEAYYYRGKYENASIAFRYIITQDEAARKKELAAKGSSGGAKSKDEPSILEEEKKSKLAFLKHKSVHNEAILWLSRTYTEAHQVENAESILSLLESDHKLNDNLKGRLALEKAFAYLAEGNNPEASKQLTIAAADNNIPNWLRLRAAFLNGQLQQNMGNYKSSAESFEQVISYYPKLEMDFYARKYIAYNKLQSGDDVEDAMKPLKRVLNDGKYVTYYDQVYFAMGQLAVKAHQNDKAITYLGKSVSSPKASKKQKALSYAALGDVYYGTANYPAAKRSYDSAAKYATSGGKDNNIAAAIQRSKGLEEIAGPGRVIHDQDSLMELSTQSKKEQLSAVRHFLRDLEKKRQDSISNAENTGVTSLVPIETGEAKDPAQNWYFSSATAMQQGKADFVKKWGNRPLKDNWRRASGNTLTNNSAPSEDDFGQGNTGGQEAGALTEEALLAKIPNTQPQKDLSAKMEQRAYILLAKAYIKQLDDSKMAIKTLDTLDIRFPNHNQKEEELYIRYQVALKANQMDKARQYSEQLLNQYPQSQYASSVRPRVSESKPDATIAGKTVAQYFDETYGLVMAHQYTEALMHVTVSKKQYENPAFQKRFEVVEAMAFAGSGDYNQGDSMITKFIRTYPADSLTPWATQVKEYIKEVRTGGRPSWYNDTMVKAPPALAKIEDKPAPLPVKPSEPAVPSDIPARYTYQPETEHYCIVVTQGVDSKTAGFKQSVRAINAASKYGDLELLFDLYSINEGALVIKKFANAAEAKSYMEELIASESFKGYAPGELQVVLASATNYKKILADKNITPYISFYTANYK
jgi:tetratricopeptide (TPR) repeat protein